ncbi:MAG: ferrous iron transport protein A [Deltaproteobacteria bacterium]|nr:ferrous iron transport protein A [Deltaproteobacteria bacterium]
MWKSSNKNRPIGRVVPIPLAMVDRGRRVRFLSVNAGSRLQAHLASLGLVPGVEIEVLNNSLKGPFVVRINGCRIMLGRGMSQKIMVI